MNIMYCFYLLLLVHLIDAVLPRSSPHLSSRWSLDRHRPSIIKSENEVTSPEPVLSRRRPQLISLERRRRWSTNDEVEIPVEQSTSETVTDLRLLLLRQDTMEINQTDEVTILPINETVSETNNTQIESVTESVVPIIVSNEVIDTNSTDSEISIETNQTISDSLTTIETNNVDLSTTNLVTEQDTAIILLDFTTVASVTSEENRTVIDSQSEVTSAYDPTAIAEEVFNTTIALHTTENNTTSVPEEVHITSQTYSEVPENVTEVTTEIIDVTTVVLDVTQNSTDMIEQEIDNTTIASNTVQSDTENTTQQVDLTTALSEITENGTTSVVYGDNEYSNETINEEPSTTAKPICDQTCQCFRKCPYGFEIVNDTCRCDPPCKNYPCFGNDTCVVSKKGQPECLPSNTSVHDRPFRCYQPQDAGYHDELIRYYERWYYNADQDACHLFVYRGQGGNKNNFASLNECHLECITCAPKPNPGLCLGHMRMWYYNHTVNQCSQFEYSGCKGNENKFFRKQDCLDTCVTRILNL